MTTTARSTFRALGYRNYRLWVSGLLISGIGTWMQMTAQDWTVLTVLTDDDATALAAVIALQTAPQLVLLPVAGYVSDRIPRRRVLTWTQVTMAVLAVILGALLLSGAAMYWHVCVLAAMTGAVQAFDSPARNTFGNELVDQEALPNAIALGGATFNLARLVGPAVAGVLIGAVGPGWIFLANAATFVATIVALALMRSSELRPLARVDGSSGRWLGGVRHVAADRRITTLIVLVFFVVGCVGSSMNLLVITAATGEFDTDSEGFGLLTSCIAVGSILGALFAASRTRPRIRLLVAATLALGVSFAVAAAMPTYLLFALVMPVIGFALMTTMSTVNAAVQTMSPPGVRGRVMGVYMLAWMGGAPVGALALGAVIDASDSRVALLVGGAAVVLTALGAAYAFRGFERARVETETTGPIPLDGAERS